MKDLSLLDERNFLTVSELSDLVFDGHICVTTINTMIKNGKIPSERLGRKNLVPVSFCRKILDGETQIKI